MTPEPLHEEALQPLSQHVEGVLVRSKLRFLSFLERRLGSRALAEEALQEALVKAIASSGTLLDEVGAVRWLFRVLTNAVIDGRRREAVKDRVLQTISRDEPEAADPEAKQTICACLDDVLDTLKPEYAAPVRRIDLDGTTVSDFAREVGISANNASVRLHRARTALRTQLVRSCGACAEHACLDCTCSR